MQAREKEIGQSKNEILHLINLFAVGREIFSFIKEKRLVNTSRLAKSPRRSMISAVSMSFVLAAYLYNQRKGRRLLGPSRALKVQ